VGQTSFHPGEHIQEELNELSMSTEDMATRLGVSAELMKAVLEGRQRVTAEFALRLGHFFGTSAQFWLNLQSMYDLRIAEKQSGRAIKSLPTLKTLKAA